MKIREAIKEVLKQYCESKLLTGGVCNVILTFSFKTKLTNAGFTVWTWKR